MKSKKKSTGLISILIFVFVLTQVSCLKPQFKKTTQKEGDNWTACVYKSKWISGEKTVSARLAGLFTGEQNFRLEFIKPPFGTKLIVTSRKGKTEIFSPDDSAYLKTSFKSFTKSILKKEMKADTFTDILWRNTDTPFEIKKQPGTRSESGEIWLKGGLKVIYKTKKQKPADLDLIYGETRITLRLIQKNTVSPSGAENPFEIAPPEKTIPLKLNNLREFVK